MHGARGEDPTEPPASAPYPYPAGLPRAAHPAALRRPDPGRAPPLPLPLGHHARRGGARLQPVHPLRHLRRLRVPGARQVRRRGDRRTPGVEHDNVDLVRNAVVRRLETDASGRTVTSVVADVDGASSASPATIVVVSAGAANSAKLLLASANDRHPHGSGQRLGPGRAATTSSTTAGPSWPSRPNPTTPGSRRRLGLNDYYFGDADFDFPMGNLQMVGKSSAPMYRGEKPIETKLAPTLRSGRRRARHRLLAVRRGSLRPNPLGEVDISNRTGGQRQAVAGAG